MTTRVAILGARRNRQGTGPFVARAFRDSGCSICAVSGTSSESADEAARSLTRPGDAPITAYTDLSELIAAESPDIVALCCPPEHRLPLLEICADAGVHCYSEKPLWWIPAMQACSPANADRTEETARRLIARFRRNGARLGVNTQWPQTLSAFESLYPGSIGKNARIERFRMLLGPANTGTRMLVDSLSHPLSMLYALNGVGRIENIRFIPQHRESALIGCELSFDYRMPEHTTAVTVTLTHSPQQPRPAAYEINGLRADRHVEPGTYLLSFAAHDKSVTMTDPLLSSIRLFLDALKDRTPPDYDPIVAGMKHLHQLVATLRTKDSAA